MLSPVVVVIPCLNEERTLAATCASLGFGLGRSGSPPDCTLVLVDNGSIDKTTEISAKIRDASPENAVLLASEPEKGYVPPRHKGCLVAKEIAHKLGVEEKSVLVLQADADTEYSPDYVNLMREASDSYHDSGVILQAITSYRKDFQSGHPEYMQLCSDVDSGFEELLTDCPEDVIVDDKACGYLLSEYFSWGEHIREYTDQREEVHSETTRLYIRSQKSNTVKRLVDSTSAEHSARHLVDHPIVDFVTAGFPRERSWIEYLKKMFAQIDNFEKLVPGSEDPTLAAACELRKAHVLSLFGVLPLHVSQTAGRSSQLRDQPWVKDIVLPRHGREMLDRPAVLILDAFRALRIETPPTSS